MDICSQVNTSIDNKQDTLSTKNLSVAAGVLLDYVSIYKAIPK